MPSSPRPLVALCCLLASLAFSPLALAQRNAPRDPVWMTDGPVYAIAQAMDKVYVGGEFKHLYPYTGCGAVLDAATGSLAGEAPRVDGPVYACIADGAGGWFIGGAFTRVGGVPRYRLAHILASGRLDPNWNPAVHGFPGVDFPFAWVLSLTLHDSTLFVGGAFGEVAGQPRNGLAALDAGTGALLAWNPNAGDVSSCAIRAMALTSSTLFIGGEFRTIGGLSHNCLAAVEADTGKVTSWKPLNYDFNEYLYTTSLAIRGSTLFVGGSFSSIGAQPRDGLAALDLVTGRLSNWNPEIFRGAWESDGPLVSALMISGSTLYVSGNFEMINGQYRSRIAALNADGTGTLTAWKPQAHLTNVENHAYSLAISGSTLYAGEEAFDMVTGNVLDWLPTTKVFSSDSGIPAYIPARLPGRGVCALAVSGSKIYAGGVFSSVGGLEHTGLAAFDAVTGDLAPGCPNMIDENFASAVYAFAVHDSTLYVGGRFESIGGQKRYSLAAVNAANDAVMDWNPNTTATSYRLVRALAVSDSTVYVGGGFDTFGGLDRACIAAVDIRSGKVTGWNPSSKDFMYVDSLVVNGSRVYAGGEFYTIGGQDRRSLAALDVVTGKATDWNPGGGNWSRDYALAVRGSTIYAAGGFSDDIGGQPRNFLAALDAVTGKAIAWNPSPNSQVLAMAPQGDTMYVGGWFNNIGGQKRYGLAALDVSSGQASAWNPETGILGVWSQVRALSVNGSTVYAGGKLWGNSVLINGGCFARYDLPSAVPRDLWRNLE